MKISSDEKRWLEKDQHQRDTNKKYRLPGDLGVSDFFTVAYKDLGGKPDIDPMDLYATADRLYICWRNELIERWAETTFSQCGLKLLPTGEKLLEMVMKLDTAYWVATESSDIWANDDEDIALCLAHVVAVIRWYSMVRVGRVAELLPAKLSDAEQWLDQYGRVAPVSKNPAQLSLFLGG